MLTDVLIYDSETRNIIPYRYYKTHASVLKTKKHKKSEKSGKFSVNPCIFHPKVLFYKIRIKQLLIESGPQSTLNSRCTAI